MKTFFAVLGSVALLVVLLLGGSAFYVYKKAGSSLEQIDAMAVKQFLSKKQVNDHVKDTLNRITEGAKANGSMAGEFVAVTALSVLVLPNAVTSEQEDMLEEAAKILENPPTTMDDVAHFQLKYKGMLPQKKQPGA